VSHPRGTNLEARSGEDCPLSRRVAANGARPATIQVRIDVGKPLELPGSARVLDETRLEPKAWSRIGKAYRARKWRIKWKEFSEALDLINDIDRAAQNGASYAESKGLIGRREKFDTIGALQRSPIGRLIQALNVLNFCAHNEAGARQILRHAARQERFSANTLQGPKLPDSELGHRIAEKVDCCLRCLKDAENDPAKDVRLEITVKLANHAMDCLQREFSRLQIVSQCQHCRLSTVFRNVPL
jgi:hypothetical protein